MINEVNFSNLILFLLDFCLLPTVAKELTKQKSTDILNFKFSLNELQLICFKNEKIDL